MLPELNHPPSSRTQVWIWFEVVSWKANDSHRYDLDDFISGPKFRLVWSVHQNIISNLNKYACTFDYDPSGSTSSAWTSEWLAHGNSQGKADVPNILPIHRMRSCCIMLYCIIQPKKLPFWQIKISRCMQYPGAIHPPFLLSFIS